MDDDTLSADLPTNLGFFNVEDLSPYHEPLEFVLIYLSNHFSTYLHGLLSRTKRAMFSLITSLFFRVNKSKMLDAMVGLVISSMIRR